MPQKDTKPVHVRSFDDLTLLTKLRDPTHQKGLKALEGARFTMTIHRKPE